MPPLVRNQSSKNLFNPTARGTLLKTVPMPKSALKNSSATRRVKKSAMFSNYSMPGNNISPNLPKGNSATSNKTLGSYVVPPTNVANTYSTNNYNRSYSGVRRKSRKNRKSRKTRKTHRKNNN